MSPESLQFPCARCGESRESLEAPCSKCDWTPASKYDVPHVPQSADTNIVPRSSSGRLVGVCAALVIASAIASVYLSEFRTNVDSKLHTSMMEQILFLPFYRVNPWLLISITQLLATAGLVLFPISIVYFIRFTPRPWTFPLFITALIISVCAIVTSGLAVCQIMSLLLAALSLLLFLEVLIHRIWRQHLIAAFFAFVASISYWFFIALVTVAQYA